MNCRSRCGLLLAAEAATLKLNSSALWRFRYSAVASLDLGETSIDVALDWSTARAAARRTPVADDA